MPVDYGTLKKEGFLSQRDKGYFSLRLKVVGGQLTVEQLRTIIDVSESYGRGHIHMTSRQGVEIPFIKLEDVEAVKQVLERGDLSPGVCGPRVRTVTACQGCDVCPSGCIQTTPLAQELDRRYGERDLPHKFKIGITGCRNNCLKAEGNDFGVKGGVKATWNRESCVLCGACEKVCRAGAIGNLGNELAIDQEKCVLCGRCVKSCPTGAWVGQRGYLAYFGGTFGNQILLGEQYVPFITDTATLLRVADASINIFVEYGRPGERFWVTLQRVGREQAAALLREAYCG